MKFLRDKYSDVFTDSRLVTENSIFVALSGSSFKGVDFVEEAISNGAKCIVTEDDLLIEGVEVIKVESARVALGFLAKEFYPLQPKHIIAVTGTNGKTSVANIGQNILANLGYKACSIGTLGVRGSVEIDSKLTTPDILSMHKILNELAEKDIQYVFLEASSHGLDLGRLDKVVIDIGIFTNITHDHLDYHGDFANYFQAKMLLFNRLLQSKKAIINADLHISNDVESICRENNHKIITYGKNIADFKIGNVEVNNAHQFFEFSYQGDIYKIHTSLLGEFQIYNILSSISAVYEVTKLPLEQIVAAANNLLPVPGRMELVSDLDRKLIFVDYAHTPDALEQSLLHARSLILGPEANKLFLVFGCGGNRDKSKRKTMGEIAQRLADKVIVTDDNPRNENPAEIIAEITAACPGGEVIHNRSLAIKHAMKLMQAGDILLIAGKGHEKYQLIGDKSFYFDDCAEVRSNIAG